MLGSVDGLATTLVPTRGTDTGFLPDTGARIIDGRLVQGTSRMVFAGGLVLIVTSIPIVTYLPLPLPARLGAGSVALAGGVSALFFVPAMRRFSGGVDVVVDRDNRTIQMQIRGEQRLACSWDEIVGIQLVEPLKKGPTQLNLICQKSGDCERLPLYTSVIGWHVRRIASRYEAFTGWQLLRSNY